MGKLTQQLARLERTMREHGRSRCPLCFGRNGEGFNARIFIQRGDSASRLHGQATCYDELGRCRRCGTVARDIVMKVVGFLRRAATKSSLICESLARLRYNVA